MTTNNRAIRHAEAALRLIPPGAATAVLMRHAERGEFAKGDHGNDVLLTPQGEKDAIAMGRVFGERRPLLFHSPVERCRQTADGIGNGTREWLPLRCDAFVEDMECASETLMRLPGGDGFYDEFVRELSGAQHNAPYPHFRPPLPSAARLMAGLMPGEGQIAVGISHDWLINITAAHAAGRILPREDFAGYLDALFVWRDAGVLHYYHKGQSGHCARNFSREFNKAQNAQATK